MVESCHEGTLVETGALSAPACCDVTRRMATVSLVGDREPRIVSDLHTTYLNAEALGDIERLGIKLVEGEPLTVCDFDADEDGRPTWLVAKGVAHFDPERRGWQIWYSIDNVHWEPREA